MLSTRYIALLALLTLTGCPTTNSGPPTVDAGGGGARGMDGAAGGTAGAAEETKLPPPDAGNPGKPLAEGCAANSECASGFCVDGVCCNTVCDGQCFNCNQTGTAGYCTAQTSGDDLNAATPCTGPRTCGALNAALNVGACRMKELQACSMNGDCASLNCETWYVDSDHDGYGDAAARLLLCEVFGAAAPGGYVNNGADCCDSDANANPSDTEYFASADACGSYDYNCDGIFEANAAGNIYASLPSGECGALAADGYTPVECK